MQKSQWRARYEQRLAIAHKSLWVAEGYARDIGDDGAADDLVEVMRFVAVLMEDSLKGKKRPARQLNLLDN